MNRRDILRFLGLAPVGGLLALSSSGNRSEPKQIELVSENYFIGNHNRRAWQVSQYFINSNAAPHLLYLYGRSGIGKTCLMDLLNKECKKTNTFTNAIFIGAESYVDACMRKSSTPERKTFQKQIDEADLLVIDDFHYLAEVQTVQAELARALKHRTEIGRKVIICSNREFRQLPGLDSAFTPIFESGVQAEIESPLFEERYEFAKFSAQRVGVTVSNKELKQIAKKRSEPRSIEFHLRRKLFMQGLSETQKTFYLATHPF